MTITSVAFDLDGTLYPDHSLRGQLLPLALRNAAFLISFAKARAEIHGKASAGLGDPAGEDSKRGPSDLEGFRRLQAELTARHWGRDAEEARVRAEATVYGSLESYFADVRLFPGVEACLSGLRARGLRLAVLSDFPPRRKLALLGIERFFDSIRSSEEYGSLKPARAPFLAIAAELGADPGQVLYVGNSLRYDILGAQSAGMKTALKVPHLGRPLPPGMARPDRTFSDYSDLPALVESLG